jgi:hypothetical protein
VRTLFDLASREDGPGILKVMESDVAKGEIRLLYTRRPNPYDSFKEESKGAVIGVFKKDGEIVGTVVGVPRDMYLEGKSYRACYVTNMKRLESHNGNLNWILAFNEMYDPLASDMYFCSVVKENTGVLKMLRKVRKNLPYTLDIDGYRTYIISPTAPIKNPCPELSFRRAGEEDSGKLLEFIGSLGRKKSLFPLFESFNDENVPKVTDFYMLMEGDEIRAAGALWDKSSSKQYVVKDYSGKVAALRAFNPLISLLGYIRIPPEETEVRFTFLSFFLAEGDEADYYRSFLHHIRGEVRKSYDMFVLGTNEHNPKRPVLDSVRALKFDTQLCEIVMSNFRGAERISFDHKNIEVECALL